MISHFRENIRFIADHLDAELRPDFLRTVGILPTHMRALLTGERLPTDALRKLISHYVGLPVEYPIATTAFDEEARNTVLRRLAKHQARVRRRNAMCAKRPLQKRGPKKRLNVRSDGRRLSIATVPAVGLAQGPLAPKL